MSRNYLFLAFLFIISGALLGCQGQIGLSEKPAVDLAASPQEGKAASQLSGLSPKITFEKTTYDFGQIGPRAKYTGEFKFKNTGEGLLKIKNVERCCGVVAKLDKTEYAPGESGVLKLEYTSTGAIGLVDKKLYVNSNDATAPRVVLTVKASVIQKVIWQPKALKLLLSEENAKCPEITLSSVDNQPFSIKSFQSTSDCITADFDPAVEANSFTIQPKVDMEKLQDTMRGVVRIGLTHPHCDGASIGFEVLSRFTLKPPLLIAFYFEPHVPIKRYFWILNNYGENFEIESTSSKEGYIKVVNQKKVRHSYQLELDIIPPALEETKRFKDELYINIKDGEKLSITCQGIYSGKDPKEQ